MVFGFFDGSIVIFAFKNNSPPIVTVVSFPLQTRFICLRVSAGIGSPLANPETIDHSPCKSARSLASASSAKTGQFMRVQVGVIGGARLPHFPEDLQPSVSQAA